MTTNQDIEILLIEDNSDDCDFILRICRKNNLIEKIKIVTDGEQAIDFLKQGKEKNIKLILLDIKLPKISGLEILRFIKEKENTKRIPVVILTSSEEYEDIKKSYELGANSFITKPVSFSDFIKAILEVIHYWISLNKAS